MPLMDDIDTKVRSGSLYSQPIPSLIMETNNVENFHDSLGCFSRWTGQQLILKIPMLGSRKLLTR